MKLLKKLFQKKNLSQRLNGIISEKIDERDFKFGSDEVIFPKLDKSFKDFNITYRQDDISPNCCTVTATMTAISNLTGLTFTLEERKKIWEMAKAQGASDTYGWYVLDAVKLVIQYVKDNWGKEFIYVQTPLRSDNFKKAIEAGYPVVTGYGGDNTYMSDIRDNSIVNNRHSGESAYYHCISLWSIDGGVDVVDHYPQRGNSNIYTFQDWNSSIMDGFFATGYTIMPKTDKVETIIDQKLTDRFNKKFIMNIKNGEIALVSDGIRTSLNDYITPRGRELLLKNGLVTGMTSDNFNKCGK